MTDSLIVGTDFSGLGGPEVALEELNVKHTVAFACEKDDFARKSYLANHSAEIFFDDVTTRDNKNAPYVDFYAFGFPCQAFSISGKRLGFEDARGTLFYNSLEYISTKQPRVFVAENVKGLLSHDKVKKSKSKYGRTFGVIRDILGCTVNGQHNIYKYDDCVNYHIHFQVLNTKEYGLPQNRERIFIVGFRDEEDSIRFKFPKKIPLVLRLKDMLEKNVPEKYYLSDTTLAYLLKDSGKWSDRMSMMNTDTDTVAGCVTANHAKGVPYNMLTETDIFACSQRGRNPKNPKSRKSGEHTEQIIEVNENPDIANTLTTVQKDNMVLENESILFDKENTTRGYTEAEHEDSINLSNPNSTTRRGRVGKQVAQTLDTACNQAVLLPLYGTEKNSQRGRIYDTDGLSDTQSAQGGGMGAKTGLYLTGKRIRRLTPLEAFRLQGYSDDFFYNCQNVNSDTQLYKQAGNAINVKTFIHLSIEILKAIKTPYYV